MAHVFEGLRSTMLRSAVLLSLGLMSLLLLATASPLALAAERTDREPVRVAFVDGLSGPFGNVGRSILQQFEFAADHVNKRKWAGPGIRFEMVPFDSQSSPYEGLAALQRAIDQGIRFVVQGNSSAMTQALVQAIERHNETHPGSEVLLLNYGAPETELTGKSCSFWHFRTEANAAQKVAGLVAYLKGRRDLHKVYLVNQSYSGGADFAQRVKEALKQERPDMQLVGEEVHPIGQVRDFRPIVERVRASGADAVITGSWGADLALLVEASHDAGLKIPYFTLYGGTPGVPGALGADGEGMLYQVASWSPNANSWLGRDLRSSYEKFERTRERTDDSSKQPATVDSDFYHGPVYTTLRMLAEGMKRAKGRDAVAVARAMEGMRFQTLNGPVEMRASDHQLLQSQAVASLRKKDGKGVRFDEEGSGYGWRIESILPRAVSDLPSSCEMKRPEKRVEKRGEKRPAPASTR